MLGRKVSPLTLVSAAITIAGATLLSTASVQAQSSNPVQIVVGFAAGGSSDGVTRIIAQKLEGELERPVIVENKPGAIGRIAIDYVVRTPAGQSVFLVAPFSSLLMPALTEPQALRYDIFKDLRPVAGLTSYPLGLAVSATTGVKNVADLKKWLAENPGKAQIATAGIGGHTHFVGLEIGKALDTNAEIVGYKGNGPLLIDLIAGHVPMSVLVAGDATQQIESGKVNLVGVLSPERSPLMPNVPTFVEQGVPVDSGNAWYGMWAPATASDEEVARMEAAVRKALADPDIQKAIADRFNMAVDFRTSSESDERLKGDYRHWEPIIKASGFKTM